MYKLHFSNFQGGNLGGGGGDKPWSKNGDKCRMGGLTKFLPDGGGIPQSSQEKTLIATVPVKYLLALND